jgi:hypothetical protein
MYSNVNNLINLLVANLSNQGNSYYDGCTDEHSLSQNLLMEKENKLSNKTFTCFVFTYSKILLFKCHTNEQRSNNFKTMFEMFMSVQNTIPNIREIFHILLNMPIESVPCERPFFALRRLKQRNRTTMA